MAAAEERAIVAQLALHRLSLRAEGFRALASNASRVAGGLQKLLEEAVEEAQERSLTVVDELVVESALRRCTNDAAETRREFPVTFVYNSFKDVPRMVYNQVDSEFVKAFRSGRLLAPAFARDEMFSERYNLLLQRLLRINSEDTRTPLFSLEGAPKSSVGNVRSETGGHNVITPVESLVGNPGEKLTFGLIRRGEGEGSSSWIIEDRHASIQLDVSNCAMTPYCVTEGGFALAAGRVHNNIFVASDLATPPAEPAEDSPRVNTFGGDLTPAQIDHLRTLESEDDFAGEFVVLSEVHLNEPSVRERLHILMETYEKRPPTMYILMGSFSSHPWNPSSEISLDAYEDGFIWLADLMKSLPNTAATSKVILIPGPNDTVQKMFPQRALSRSRTAFLTEECRNVLLATNPCRIRHYGQELVFFRHDVQKSLLQSRVLPIHGMVPAMTMSDIREETVKAIFNQAHLSPTPISVYPVAWDFDSALRLYPLPTAVCVGDASDAFSLNYVGSEYVSAGSFAADGTFYLYRAEERHWERSGVRTEKPASSDAPGRAEPMTVDEGRGAPEPAPEPASTVIDVDMDA